MLTVDIKKKLHNFTLELKLEHKSGCLGILGPSGCGKSIGLKSIAGLVTPDSGLIRLGEKIFFSGEEHVRLRPQLRKTGYLFQNYALFPNMTVEENIASGLSRTDSARKEKAAACLKQFQLSGLEHYYPAQLSGGQQQRTALARILASSPELLLLDEPFSAMDLSLREMLRLELSRALKDYHALSILVTHDRDEVFQLCDRLLVMEDGRVLCEGPTKEIFRSPRTLSAARLTGFKNISPIRRTGGRQFKALSWKLTLTANSEIPDWALAVGIRPYALIPVNGQDAAKWEGQPEANLIPVRTAALSALPFEWEVLLDNSIRWTVKKTLDAPAPPALPGWLRVKPEDLVFLK